MKNLHNPEGVKYLDENAFTPAIEEAEQVEEEAIPQDEIEKEIVNARMVYNEKIDLLNKKKQEKEEVERQKKAKNRRTEISKLQKSFRAEVKNCYKDNYKRSNIICPSCAKTPIVKNIQLTDNSTVQLSLGLAAFQLRVQDDSLFCPYCKSQFLLL